MARIHTAYAFDPGGPKRGRSNALLALAIAGLLLASGCGSNQVGQTSTPGNAPLPPPPVPLAWVSALSVGQWYPIPNTALSSVAPSTTPDGNTGPQSKVITWTSFVVDIRTSKVYSVANGGHQDYSGNEVDVLNLELDQPAWTELLAPSPNSQLTDCQMYYADGRPASRHTYYGVTLDETNDRIMLFGGANWCTSGGFFTAISSYNIGANAYSPSTTHGTLTSPFANVPAYSRDPSTGDVYAFQGGNYGHWTRSANAFGAINPSGTGPDGLEAMSAMDTTRGRILVAGGLHGGDRHLFMPSSNSFTSITFTGASAGVVPGAAQGGMVYIAAIDRFLFRLKAAGGTVYQINPATFEVTPFATTGGASIPATLNGPYNKFLYIPRLGGCIYVPSYTGDAWFLRVH